MSLITTFKKVLLIACIPISPVLKAQTDTLLQILQEELNRESEVLSKAEYPAYYIDYRVEDVNHVRVEANLGSLINTETSHIRMAQIGLRVGNYDRDHTHEIKGNYSGGMYFGNGAGGFVPVDNKPKALKQSLWRSTNSQYTSAVERYKQVSGQGGDSETPDFSKENTASYYEKPVPFKAEQKKWGTFTKKLSAHFLKDENIIQGRVQFTQEQGRQYYVNTEGTHVVQNKPSIFLLIAGQILTDEGERIPLYKTYSAASEGNLPSYDSLVNDVNDIIEMLKKLSEAPLAEPYTGPAILHPRVAGVFFHEIFGHRIEGHRLKSELDGQTFKEKISQKVLPGFINVYSDPTLSKFNNQDLNGYYHYDDQGVKAQKVNVVEKGYLKTFLMSRSPLENITQSNGHGRAQMGMDPVSRQSNLIIESSEPKTNKELRQLLKEECMAQGKEYGYYFVDVTGGYTQTDRYSPNAFNIMPTIVYKVYVDDRPDELVRGVDLIGTPLAMFAEIAATGDQRDVFNGTCGAESGGVPVSAVAPGLFVRRIETQKKPVALQETEKPLLPMPKLDDDE